MSLLDALGALPTPASTGAYSLGGYICRGCRLGKSSDNAAAVLIEVAETGASTARRLENLRYDPPAQLAISKETGPPDLGVYAVLTCSSEDDGMRGAFLRIAAAMFDPGAGPILEHELERMLDELVSLFRALSRPGAQTIQGLWAEVALIFWSSDPQTLLTSWHSGPRALHDFSAGAHHIEVKSCGTGLREHSLRLEQLNASPGGHTLFASVVVEETDGGTSVAALAEALLARLDHNLEARRRLETIIGSSLGQSWREADTRSFDLDAALSNLRVYDARQLPTLIQPIPPEIRGVRFTLDFSTTDPLSLEDARDLGAFFAQALPPPKERRDR